MMVSDQMTFMPLVTLVFLVTLLILFRRLWLGLRPSWACCSPPSGRCCSVGAVFGIFHPGPHLILVIGVADGIHWSIAT